MEGENDESESGKINIDRKIFLVANLKHLVRVVNFLHHRFSRRHI